MVPDPLLFTFALISTGALSFLLVYYVSLPHTHKKKKQCNKRLTHFIHSSYNYPYILLNNSLSSIRKIRQLHFQTWNVII